MCLVQYIGTHPDECLPVCLQAFRGHVMAYAKKVAGSPGARSSYSSVTRGPAVIYVVPRAALGQVRACREPCGALCF